ncbi:MAG: tetratricopeptide repeat protein [Verrucomicrobiota bacterium]|nr:tetratricopeptide repeat protein [Verrucomicrobiota bacterium]
MKHRKQTSGKPGEQFPWSRRLSFETGWLWALLLGAATVVAYLPAWHAGFIWDDNQYVTNNPTLRSLHGLWQIWLQPGATPQYYPLTFTTFWLEYHLWGLNPLGYHLLNVVLQSANAILVWIILRKLRVPGAWLAAGLFALHPVCVESVAWVTERKNMLSGFLYLCGILAAIRFWLPEGCAEDGRVVAGQRRWRHYGLALGLYACALLAKTATVPLPCVILLLVWWKKGLNGRDVLATAPFFAMGMAMGLVTIHVEKDLGAGGGEWGFSLLERCVIASRDFWFYLGKLVWPCPLIFDYPRWKVSPAGMGACVPGTALITVLAVLWVKRGGRGRPVLTALFYFLALLFPVLGFVNVYYFRYSFVADHFQYLACMGPLALLAAGIVTTLGFLKRVPMAQAALAGVLFLILGALTWRQCEMYAGMETLWKATLAQNPGSFLAQDNLGKLLLDEGKTDAAIVHLQKAVALEADDATAQNNLGAALLAKGRVKEAVARFEEALKLQPDYSRAYNNLGKVFLQNNQTDRAIAYFKKALASEPDLSEAQYNLGNAYLRKRQVKDAIVCWQAALSIQPDNAPAYGNIGYAFLQMGKLDWALTNLEAAVKLQPGLVDAQNDLGSALIQAGRPAEAVEHLRRALETDPNFAPALNNLAWELAACPEASVRNGPGAIALAERANRLYGGKNPVILRTLAAADAEGGDFTNAILTAQTAMHLAAVQGNPALADNLRAQIRLYEAGQPFRDGIPVQGSSPLHQP